MDTLATETAEPEDPDAAVPAVEETTPRRWCRCSPSASSSALIPEVEPDRLWQRLLQNQRGAVVAHAVRGDTDAVICRLRFRLSPDPRAAPRAGRPRHPRMGCVKALRAAVRETSTALASGHPGVLL